MAELSKLRWQCRRGTKELDLLLMDYLETRYLSSSKQRQAQFIALLALEDDELMPVLMDFIK
jgi:antitoxin CptB